MIMISFLTFANPVWYWISCCLADTDPDTAQQIREICDTKTGADEWTWGTTGEQAATIKEAYLQVLRDRLAVDDETL